MFRHLQGRPTAAPCPGLAGTCSRLFSALILICALAAVSCGTPGHRVTNQPPQVEIVGSPVEGDSVNYVVDFFWHAWDDDGAVVRSEYAVDIPASFTSEQIADPATPGIEWTSTTGTHALFRFSVAPPLPKAAGPATPGPTNPVGAPHTFYVRVFDNEGGYSPVADRSVNAFTVLPKTTITEIAPPTIFVGRPYRNVCKILKVRWRAVDPDGRPPDYRVARTEYKLISVRGVSGVTDANYVVTVDPGPNFPWLPVPGDSAALTLQPEPGAYVLALRSVDEAGGVESRFEFGRNALLFQWSRILDPGKPILTVSEPVLGTNSFPRDGWVVDYEIIAGRALQFEMSADAQSYGGVVSGYRWCVDAPDDPADPDATGCVPWGSTRRLPRLWFPSPGIHTVAFAARANPDECGGGGVTSGTFRLTAVAPLFDRDVLYVDDFFDPTTDAETDRRFLAALRSAGYANVRTFDAWGVGDLEGAVNPIRLSELIRYRLVFWSVRGFGGGSQNANTALLQASSCATNRVLQTYVAAGGAVWINGEMVFGALKDRSGNLGTCLATTGYDPSTGLNFDSGSFVTDYLHIAGGDIRNAKTGTTSNGLLRARPTARARAEGFPTLEADSTMYAYAALGGLPFYDAMFQPTFLIEGGLDTLYTAEPVRTNSAFRNKPIAWRYADPSPEPTQGAVAITSFPLHKMKEGVASREVNGVPVPGTGMYGLVEAMAKWFRAHDATQAAARPWVRGASGLHPRYDAREGRN